MAEKLQPAAALQFRFEDFRLPLVFVADIDVSLLRAGYERGDHHALHHQIGKALQDKAVLDGAWLALIRIADHIFHGTGGAEPLPI